MSMNRLCLKNLNVDILREDPSYIDTYEYKSAVALFDELKENKKQFNSKVDRPQSYKPIQYFARLLGEKYMDNTDYPIPLNEEKDYIFCVLSGRLRIHDREDVVPIKPITRDLSSIKGTDKLVELTYDRNVEVTQGVKRLESSDFELNYEPKRFNDKDVVKNIIEKINYYVTIKTQGELDDKRIISDDVYSQLKDKMAGIIDIRNGRLPELKPLIDYEWKSSRPHHLENLKKILKNKYFNVQLNLLSRKDTELLGEPTSIEEKIDLYQYNRDKINKHSRLYCELYDFKENTTKWILEKENLIRDYHCIIDYDGNTLTPTTIEVVGNDTHITFDNPTIGKIIILKDRLGFDSNGYPILNYIFELRHNDYFIYIKNVKVSTSDYASIPIDGIGNYGCLVQAYDRGVGFKFDDFEFKLGKNHIFVKSLTGSNDNTIDLYILPFGILVEGLSRRRLNPAAIKRLYTTKKDYFDLPNMRFVNG